MENVPQVTILGAGIVGVCCTLSALESGFTVRVIDKDAPGQGASYGNAGVISPYSVVPQSLPGLWRNVPSWLFNPKGPVKLRWRDLPLTLPWALRFLAQGTADNVARVSDHMSWIMRDNITAYRRYLKGTSQEDLIRDSLYVNVFQGRDRPDLNDLGWRLRSERGAPVHVVNAGELHEIEPNLSPEYHSAVIISGQARATDPGRLTQVLAETAKKMGAEFIQANVKGLANGGTAITTTEGQTLHTEKLVLTAGIWSRDLLHSIGIKMPLMAERGYHLEFPDPGVALNNSVLDISAKFVASSMEGGMRAAGTVELARADAPPNFARANVLEGLARRMIPGLNTDGAKPWMGIRPSFPDNLPAIGAIPQAPNLIAAFGHSHYGMSMAPGTGRIVADILAGRHSNTDLSRVSPSRYL